MKKNKFKILVGALVTALAVSGICIYKVHSMKVQHEKEIKEITQKYEKQLSSLRAYEYLYKENEKDLQETNKSYKDLKIEYDNFKTTVAMSNTTKNKLSRGGSISSYKDLREFDPITINELNEWIDKKAPSNSPFRGKAEVFIKASQQTGLDPKYIIAHASVESGWGTSPISREKGNYFGIGSYNNSPYSSSLSFDGGLYDGIIEGSKWINKNYITRGQHSLYLMEYGNKNKIYCQKDDGSPDDNWINQILDIMSN